MIDGIKQAVSGAVTQGINNAVASIGTQIAHFLISASYSIALIGGGILIVLYVAGYKKAMRYTGVLFVSHVLIRYLLG